jgi:uncharacterized phage protein (TIGR02220 family)
MKLIQLNPETADLIEANRELVETHLSDWIKGQKKVGSIEAEILEDLSDLRKQFDNNCQVLKVTFGRKQLIKARVLEGHSLEDFKLVHRQKLSEWWQTEFRKYCVPETLYRETNFSRYLESAKDPRFNRIDSLLDKQSATDAAALKLFTND